MKGNGNKQSAPVTPLDMGKARRRRRRREGCPIASAGFYGTLAKCTQIMVFTKKLDIKPN